MDKLQHIDDLLKRASQVPANALVTDSDWTVVEKKLKQRKNRIYATWFFLALITASAGVVSLLYFNYKTTSTFAKETSEQDATISSKKSDKISHKIPTNATKATEAVRTTHSQITIEQPFQKQFDKIFIEKVEEFSPIQEAKITKDIHLTSRRLPRTFSFLNQEIQDLSKVPFLEWSIKHPTSELLFVSNANNKSNNTPVPLTIKGYWEVGFAFTPSISNKIESYNTELDGLIHKNYNNYVAKGEKSSFSNSLGLNIQYHTNKQWYVASGLFFSQRAEYVDYNYVNKEFVNIFNHQITQYVEYTNDSKWDTVSYQGSNSYHFIEIPLNIGFKRSISPNFEIRSQVGLSYMTLQKRNGKKGDFTTLELKDLTQLDLNTSNIATNIKSGLYYNTPRLAIGIEPMFGMNLNSLNNTTTSAIKTKPYSYGINLTTNIKLVKR